MDDGLDGDEVADHLLGRPLPVGPGRTVGCPGRRGDAIRERSEPLDEARPRAVQALAPSWVSFDRRQLSVASTALNRYRWNPLTLAAGSASVGAIPSSSASGR